MNNWSLLLLALVAVFQPIASFTERSVFDGRQCCDRQLHSPLRAPNRLIDDSLRSDRALPEDRRVNRYGVREIHQYERKANRQTSKISRRLQELDSPTRSRIQYRLEKIKSDDERHERHFSRRNYESTRHELNFVRLSLERNERARNTKNRRDASSRNEIRRAHPLKLTRVVFNREENRLSRGEFDDGNIRRNTRHAVSVGRRSFLRDEAAESEPLAKDRRSRDDVIRSRRSSMLPNTRNNENIRVNRNSGHNSLRENFHERRVTVRNVERRQQSNENRISRDTFIRRNLRDRMSIQNAQRDSPIHRTTDYRSDRISNIRSYDSDRYDTAQKGLIARRSTNRMVSRRMYRESFSAQDSELNRRTRSSVRRDYRDGSATEKTIRSTESRRDASPMNIKYEIEKKTTTERETMDFRKLKVDRIRDNLNVYQYQEQIRNQTNGNWLNILYTLQGIYLCGLIMQIFNGNDYGKCKSRKQRWWYPSATSFIKAE